MFLKLGIFILLAVVIASDCERYPSLPLLSGSYKQISRSFLTVPKGRSLRLTDMKIAYYRDSVENKTIYPTREIESLLKDITFVKEKPTVFYIHGYIEYVTDNSVSTVMSAYIKHGGYNVLALDWANLAFGNYLNVLLDVQPVGDEAGGALLKLVRGGLQARRLHVVGHSIGAHVGAVAARLLAAEGYHVESIRRGVEFRYSTSGHYPESWKWRRNSPYIRLTGLDPANPGFYPPLVTDPISPKDALFVDIIHTAGGQLGSAVSGGHVDFWPNGGKPAQPGCPITYIPFSDEYFCSHWRSWRYWAESVLGGKFVAKKCASYDAFLEGSCSGQALMGLQATPDLHGDYYLRTADEEPFALEERGV